MLSDMLVNDLLGEPDIALGSEIHFQCLCHVVSRRLKATADGSPDLVPSVPIGTAVSPNA